VCDLETSRIGAPYIYDISNLRVKRRGLNGIVSGCMDIWFLHLVKVKDFLKGRLDTPRFTDTSLELYKHWHVCYQQFYEATWLPRHGCAKK
jgi:hypothetical protein